MTSTAAQITHAPPDSATPRHIAPPQRDSASSEHLTWGQVFDETTPGIGAPAFFGPPVSFVLVPWLFLVLLLMGPFALVVTLVLVLALAAGMLALLVAVIASPYLLIRHLHAHGTVHAKPRASLHPFRNHRVSVGRLGSLQPKGVS